MLLAVDLMVRHTGEDFIDEVGVAIASVLPLQSLGIFGAEFDTPQANRFAADSNASLSEKILDLSVAEVEAVVQPDRGSKEHYVALAPGDVAAYTMHFLYMDQGACGKNVGAMSLERLKADNLVDTAL
jgi:hypothetical protein